MIGEPKVTVMAGWFPCDLSPCCADRYLLAVSSCGLSLCMRTPGIPSYKDTGPIGSGPYDVASVNLNSLSKCPVSQYSCSEVRASIYELMWDEGGDNGAGKHRSGLNTKL